MRHFDEIWVLKSCQKLQKLRENFDFTWNQFWLILEGQNKPFKQFWRLTLIFGENSHLKMSKFIKIQVKAAQMVKLAVFAGLQNAQNWFHVKFEWEKILKFSHFVFPIRLPRTVFVKVRVDNIVEWDVKST